MRHQFVLDAKRNRTLNRLAADGAGSRSALVRRGIDLVAEEEAILDATEADPDFLRMMEESEKAIREGRVTPHAEVMRQFRAAKRAARKKRV
jgi:hypothetical protein